MAKKIFIALFSLMISSHVFAFRSDVSVGVGPAWNQVLAIEHFTVNNQNNKQAKTVITGLDNPCAAIAADLNFTFDNKYYLELVLYDIVGNKGSSFFNQSLQESPFNVITHLDGPLNTNVFEVGLISGINVPISDKIIFTLGGGYLYFHAKRFLKFIRDDLRLNVRDIFNGGLIKVGPTINLNEKVNVSALYLLGIGKLKTQICNLNTHEITYYNFPLYMNNIVILNSSYKINEEITASLAAAWYVAQNIKNGNVQQSATDALLFSNRCATLFRSQFYFMTFNINYSF